MGNFDVLSDILATLRLSSDIYFRAVLGGDCAVRVPEQGRQIRFHLVLQGACRISVDGAPAVTLAEGDLALVPRGAAQIVAHGSRAAAVPLDQLIASGALADGVLTAGSGSGLAVLVCGFLAFDEAVAHPVLAALPPLVALRLSELTARPATASALRLLDVEARAAAPGAGAILPRLVEIVVIQCLRDLAAESAEASSGFLAALADRHIARAIGALHRAPERPWTVGGLAAVAGMSRTRFAARFLDMTGATPLAYLTRWRLMRARALLATTTLSIDDVALRCGYASLPSFTRRFSTTFGMGPGKFRREAAG